MNMWRRRRKDPISHFHATFFLLLFAVSMETTVFGAGLGMCVLVVVFFLYMNRKWCFSNTSGNFPCCDEKSLSTKTIHSFSKYQINGKACVTVKGLTSKRSVTATCKGGPFWRHFCIIQRLKDVDFGDAIKLSEESMRETPPFKGPSGQKYRNSQTHTE